MYDFFLGSSEEIERDELRYLISVKRMTPRWINSMPDSEFTALCMLLDEQGSLCRSDGVPFVCIETGVGASSLALAYFAAKYEGVALSWDMNSAKGSAVRQVLSETVSAHFGIDSSRYWKLIAADSTSPFLGLGILGELCEPPTLSFHDSEHTWTTLGKELELVGPHLRDGAVVALDDANLQWNQFNMGYVNTFRRKLGLVDAVAPAGNVGDAFHLRCDTFLRKTFEECMVIDDFYKHHYLDDAYFAYFAAEFDIKASLGTERSDTLDHRFDAWRVWRWRG